MLMLYINVSAKAHWWIPTNSRSEWTNNTHIIICLVYFTFAVSLSLRLGVRLQMFMFVLLRFFIWIREKRETFAHNWLHRTRTGNEIWLLIYYEMCVSIKTHR